ncbi:glutaredoxin family protein [Psychrobacter sp. LV10R520-6]|uniref:glutaredoxin family protein n=1 Tax=Psychrobacter sp. LV10R520-6 TaxID=1415574 RepID=UPI0024C86626|nr:glutaredoxin family protein [Psychrobacter sp. LV10R520-6]SNT70335.1 Glutaredoxin-like domain [Psychrobacter sp. LV10R520-6]
MSISANSHDSIEQLRARIITALPSLGTPECQDEWWLLGTSGCHLCTEAKYLLARFQAVQPITYQDVDIAEFGEPLMMAFATTIPVLLTPSKRLNYPFSVMDLQQLA